MWAAIVKNETDIIRVTDRLRLVLPVKQVVTIKGYRKKRSIAQNALMWLWYDAISQHILESKGDFYSSEDIHEFFKQLFLPKRVIEFKAKPLQVQVGTSDLNVMEMMEYLDKLDYYCAEKLHLFLPKPEDLWLAAKGV